MAGWELVERRGDGKWYTVSRSFERNAYVEYQHWMATNRGTRQVILRQVSNDDPVLTASLVPDPNTDNEEGNPMADRQTSANRDGYTLASAIYTLLGKPKNPDNAAVFTLGRRFALFAGYSDADSAFSYIEGFVQGFRDGEADSQKSIEAPRE